MKKRIGSLLIALALACTFAFAGAEGSQDVAYERCRGIWVSGGIAVEIWREGEEILCRAVLTEAGEVSDIWEYNTCLFDEAGDTLQCYGVTRTRERFESLFDMIAELDWSTDDMSISELRLSEDGLLFIDDELDAPVALTRLSEAEGTERNEALAFVGLWNADSATLRVEDRGACYRFTVTVPADDETSYRWTYTCLYDSDGGRMASVNVSRRTLITHMANGDTVEVEEDFVPSNAEFILEEGNRLIWRDMSGDGNSIFDRNIG